MYVTALLIILLLICIIKSNDKGKPLQLKPFDKDTNLPLRGLMALLIVLSHIGQKTDIAIIENFDSNRFDIGAQIVSIFFFMSGYGMMLSYSTKRKQYIKGFLKKRLGTVLPKFILLTVGTILMLHYFVDLDIERQLTDFVTRGITPLPHSWFIFAILYVYLAFYLCALSDRSPIKVANLFLLSSLFYIAVMIKILHFYPYWWVSILSVNLGAYVAIYRNMISDFIRKHSFATYSGLVFLLLLTFCILDIRAYRFPTLRVCLLLFWYLVQSLSCYVIVRTLGFVRWKWLGYCGLISLDIYLIHGIPLKIADEAGLDDWNLLLVTYMLVLPAAIILNRLFDRKYMLQLYRRCRSKIAHNPPQDDGDTRGND